MKQTIKNWISGMKVTQWKGKLLLTGIYLGTVALYRYWGIPCLFLSRLKIPCPGCGMSRAMMAALHLDFAGAFRYHPMFWSMPILYAYYLLDKGLFRKQKLDRAILLFIAAGFIIQWVAKIVVSL